MENIIKAKIRKKFNANVSFLTIAINLSYSKSE